MNTAEIEKIVKNIPKLSTSYLGTFPIDFLPHVKIRTPSALIINTDVSSLNGKHWFALYLSNNAELFNSLGGKPTKRIKNFINHQGLKLICNSNQIQSSRSNICAKYCILFLIYKTKGLSLADFLSLFSNNSIYNDEIVNKIFHNYCTTYIS